MADLVERVAVQFAPPRLGRDVHYAGNRAPVLSGEPRRDCLKLLHGALRHCDDLTGALPALDAAEE